MTELRALTTQEIEQVCGGYYNGDVVVVGSRGDAYQVSFNNGYGYDGSSGSGVSGGGGRDPYGFYPDVTADDPPPPVGGGGMSDAEFQGIIADIVLGIADKAWDYYQHHQDQKHDREVALARSFDPANIAREQFHVDGNPERIYTMSDGSTFIDHDGNGTVDAHVKFDPVGNGAMFIDDGDGWKRAN